MQINKAKKYGEFVEITESSKVLLKSIPCRTRSLADR